MTALAFANHLRELAARSTRPATPGRELATPGRVLAGVAGEPGVGKSTFATGLALHLGDDALVIPMDGFHLPQARLVELGRRDRMGAPDTFDVDGFAQLLTEARTTPTLLAPDFDREIEEPVPGAIRVEPHHRILIVEGNYLLHDADCWERIAGLLDATVFLTLDAATRHERLIARHIRHGKTPDAARAWTLGPDETNAELIRAGANRADIRVAVD